MKIKLLQKKGYTYLELIIVIAIFSIISVVISGVFILFTKAQAKTTLRQKLIAEGRYIVETIVRDIRVGRIDYDAYGLSINNPQDTLYLTDNQGEQIRFNLEKSECSIDIESCIFYVKKGKGGLLSGQDVNVDYLSFYISPNKNPFVIKSGEYLSNTQPSVTLMLGLSVAQGASIEPISINLQTTVSSKVYER